MVRARAEREDALWLAVDIEPQWIGKNVRIVVWRKRRRPYYHAFEDACAAHLGVERGDARKGEIAVAAESQAFLDRVWNQRRIPNQLVPLVVVRVKQVQRTAGSAAGGRQRRAADAENLVEQFAVVELVAGIAGIDEITDEVRARADAPLIHDHLDLFHSVVEGAPQFRRPRLAWLNVSGAWNHIVERDEDRLAPFVHIHHRIKQRVDDEMRAVILYTVERGPVSLDTVQHAVDDPSDAFLELFDPSRREGRRQQAADAGMLLAVHLRHELGVHNLVELLPPRATRHL